MNPIEKPASDRQRSYIASLCAERSVALGSTHTNVLAMKCDTSKQASALIDVLLMVPRDPQPEDTGLKAEVEALRQALPTLDPSDLKFASSLVRRYDRDGALTERQRSYVISLGQPKQAPQCDPQVGDLVAVGDDVIIIVAGKSGRPYGKRLVEGRWRYESGLLQRAQQGAILKGEALARIASEYGHATGVCMFCARDLTDERSIEVGYGPVCAGHHDLPWGQTTAV
jgi:hypothetical protein